MHLFLKNRICLVEIESFDLFQYFLILRVCVCICFAPTARSYLRDEYVGMAFERFNNDQLFAHASLMPAVFSLSRRSI